MSHHDHESCQGSHCHHHHHSHEDCCSHEHHHHHHCQCGCGCGHESSECHCHCHHENFSHELLEMADEAWQELLFDKIKQKIEKTSGKHLDELADLVANSNHERWIEKMKIKDLHEKYEDKISSFFKK